MLLEHRLELAKTVQSTTVRTWPECKLRTSYYGYITIIIIATVLLHIYIYIHILYHVISENRCMYTLPYTGTSAQINTRN